MGLLSGTIRRLLQPIRPLPPGLYACKAPPDAPLPYRLHLRLEPDGRGVLLINASIVLHLNPTAAEFAYHMVQRTPADQVISQIARRYRVPREKAAQDYHEFIERVEMLCLDPGMELGFERQTPETAHLSAPYRLDCALTWGDDQRLPGEKREGELGTDEWLAILDKAWAIGIPHVVFTGAEPAQRSDLETLLEYAEHLGMVTGLVNGGLRLGDSAYLDRLIRAGLDHVMVIVNPEDRRSWEALSSLIYWREVLESRLHIAAHLTLTPENRSDFPHWLEKIAATGLQAISLTASHPELARSLLQTRDRAASLGLTLIWNMPVPYANFNPFSLEKDDESGLFNPRAYLYIEPEGDVRLTFGDGRTLGNILRDSWKEIWGQNP
jgi:hypothetical protein